jgi:hypothetical protein
MSTCCLCCVATYDAALFEGALPNWRLVLVGRADDADRLDHIWVSRREPQGCDAASSISQDVGGRNAQCYLMMLQRTSYRTCRTICSP